MTWFGGEALLELPVIQRLTERFLALVADYNASIITNGSLLSSKVSRRLVDLRVTWAQIRLDGPREVHDARRPMVGKHPTFDKILGNIAEADPGLAITIRVNVDQSNAGTLASLFDQLDAVKLLGRVAVYFAPVTPICQRVRRCNELLHDRAILGQSTVTIAAVGAEQGIWGAWLAARPAQCLPGGPGFRPGDRTIGSDL